MPPSGAPPSESHRPVVSIVIAVFNAARTLERCLESIHAQEWPHEILVADGGSTDGSVEILTRHAARFAYWHSRRDAGIADAWNSVLDRATGAWVMFIGADDYFTTADDLGRLARMDDGRAGLLTARAAIVTSDGHVREVVGGPWTPQRMLRGMVVAHPATLHRRRLFRDHGGFDTRYRIAADFEFLLRLPPDTGCRDLDAVVVALEDGGMSRAGVLEGVREVSRILAGRPEVGSWRAWWRLRLGELKYLVGHRILPIVTFGAFARPPHPTAVVLHPAQSGGRA